MTKAVSVVISMLLLSIASNAIAADACVARSGPRSAPLVELYTSEGCSSCPPADRWLSENIRDRQANYLAFHVDYWDDLGWPDRFALAQYSQRQRTRVGAVGQQAVFTPQVMVGSNVQAPWRSTSEWRRVVEQARRPSAVALTVRLLPTATGWQADIDVAPVVAGLERANPASAIPAGARLWVARYIDAQVSNVHAGENRGVTLRHDRVVRELSGPWALPSNGALSRRVGLPVEAAHWGVTAFVQDARGNVLQSLSLPASNCARSKVL